LAYRVVAGHDGKASAVIGQTLERDCYASLAMTRVRGVATQQAFCASSFLLNEYALPVWRWRHCSGPVSEPKGRPRGQAGTAVALVETFVGTYNAAASYSMAAKSLRASNISSSEPNAFM
jgi:hypothetical protein